MRYGRVGRGGGRESVGAREHSGIHRAYCSKQSAPEDKQARRKKRRTRTDRFPHPMPICPPRKLKRDQMEFTRRTIPESDAVAPDNDFAPDVGFSGQFDNVLEWVRVSDPAVIGQCEVGFGCQGVCRSTREVRLHKGEPIKQQHPHQHRNLSSQNGKE